MVWKSERSKSAHKDAAPEVPEMSVVNTFNLIDIYFLQPFFIYV